MQDISHLPKSMQKRPEIRGLSLLAYRGDSPSHFRVPGAHGIYDVYAVNDSYYCGCQGGSKGAKCAHIYAVIYGRERQEII